MVTYIGVSDIQRLVQALGPAEFIARLAGEIEADYRRWPEFENSPRLASHSAVGVIELMPATDGKLYSFKYVNGHPKNTNEGLLTVMAFGVLAEVDTGYPLLLSELTVTTALRTAATSALAARKLARPESRVMALIGNGAQSEFQAIAFHRLVGIRELHLFDVDARATAKLMHNLAAMPELADLHVVRAASAAEACRGADIVTTVTADKRNAVILTPPMIAPGMHINGVGGDCPGKTELHPDILRMNDIRVVVEFEPQSRHEGEIQQMPADYPVIELASVIRGEVQARRSPRDITLFDSVGFALEDYSALRFLHGLVQEQKFGRRELDLVPELADPKDLFGGTLGAGRAVTRQRSRRTA
jgi:ornithine cyclodeaminase